MNPTLKSRIDSVISERVRAGTLRKVRVNDSVDGVLNLADNDYLSLSRDARLQKAGREAINRFGCSSSASPLITGFGPTHRDLLASIESWYGIRNSIAWNSGYVANQALLHLLPRKGDLVLADRFIHNSAIAGILSSGSRLLRYRHCDLEHLEALLKEHAVNDRVLFVVTESVFSMDGDYPNLKAIANLREQYGFYWVLDEAHAVGWYGEEGSGLAEEFGVLSQVDALLGTLGKALGSMGAYTLFKDEAICDYLVNLAGEFIYSTYMPPVCAAVATEAIQSVRQSKSLREKGKKLSSRVRIRLKEMGFDVALGDSPIISIPVGEANRVMKMANEFANRKILVGAVRPPTVPEGTSRLRISLKADLADESIKRFLDVLGEVVGTIK